MVERAIVWTKTAAKQRKEILKYWVKRNGSPKYARKLIRLTRKRVRIIRKHPLSFQSTDFPGTRVSSLGHFSILYKLTDRRIYITAFWDNRQDPKKLLETLKS